MKDLHLQTDPMNRWSLDIRISKGQAEQLPDTVVNRDQREPLMMYFMRGTVPYHRDVGIAWGEYEIGKMSLIDIDNDIKKAIDAFVATEGTALRGIPYYQTTPEGRTVLSMYRPEEVTK